MILLGVNVDHVATLRQARYRDEPNTFGGFVEPDPASMAWLAEDAGADQRPDHDARKAADRSHGQISRQNPSSRHSANRAGSGGDAASGSTPGG